MAKVDPRPPEWNELSAKAQADLASRGFDRSWFSGVGADEEIRLTVLNIYVKLRSVSIVRTPAWNFIGTHKWAGKGNFMFLAMPVNTLKYWLEREPTFANPEYISWGKGWDSRELCREASLHFRHKSSWSEEIVSVHIDPAGLATSPGVRGKISPGQGIEHFIDYLTSGYEKPAVIREILVRQGWDAACLMAPGTHLHLKPPPQPMPAPRFRR